MRSSSASRDILLWYVLLLGPFFFSLLLFSLLSSLSFSNPYFFPWQAVQASFWVKEITNYYHRQMKEDEGRRNVAVKAFNVVKKSNQELKIKLLEKEREREKKSAATAFDSAEKQIEGQRVLLCNVEDQLAASKTQIVALKKKLEEAEKARELAEKALD